MFVTFVSPMEEYYRCWRAVLLPRRHGLSEREINYTQLLQEVVRSVRWSVLLCSGGHFAGGVFERGQLTHQRTFHRYVVRKKQGGLQSARDQSGSKPKSAGATIRRYNEQALQKEIRALLLEWSPLLQTCKLIFIYAPSSNRLILFNFDDSPLVAGDPRIRSVPFSVRRPTVKEVQRIFEELTSWRRISFDDFQKDLLKQPKKQALTGISPADRAKDVPAVPNKTSAIPEPRTHAETIEWNAKILRSIDRPDELTSEAEGARSESDSGAAAESKGNSMFFIGCKKGNMALVKALLAKGADVNAFDGDGLTGLHLAAMNGHGDLVTALLEWNADPTLKSRNTRDAPPFVFSLTERVRNSFRKYRLTSPTKWNYDVAGISGAIVDEPPVAAPVSRKAAVVPIKPLSWGSASAGPQQPSQPSSTSAASTKSALSALSRDLEREKRAAAAERRMFGKPSQQSGASKCYHCSLALSDSTSVAPFSRLEFTYCSIECLQKHKLHLECKSK